MRKIFGIALLILGAGSFIFGSFVAHKAALGDEKISEAEQNQQDRRKPIIGPIRKSVYARTSENAQKKIGEKSQIVAIFHERATWLRGLGIVLFAAGVYCVRRAQKPGS